MSERAQQSVSCKTVEHQRPQVADYRIRRVMQAIEADPSQDIRALARMVNLSSSRLSHLFKIATGTSLQSYLSNWRLEAAAALLQSTETPIKEVSYSVGYRHAPSFVVPFGTDTVAVPTTTAVSSDC